MHAENQTDGSTAARGGTAELQPRPGRFPPAAPAPWRPCQQGARPGSEPPPVTAFPAGRPFPPACGWARPGGRLCRERAASGRSQRLKTNWNVRFLLVKEYDVVLHLQRVSRAEVCQEIIVTKDIKSCFDWWQVKCFPCCLALIPLLSVIFIVMMSSDASHNVKNPGTVM